MFDIFLNIKWIERSAFFFNSTVFTHSFRMRTQIFTESNMPFQFLRISRAYIQMMLPQMGFAFIFKCFPSGNTKVSFMVIVDSF